MGHEEIFESWKKDLTPKYLEQGLTKENSRLFVGYIVDMSEGNNIPKSSKLKGSRTPKTLNRVRSKMGAILRGLQNEGVKDVSKVTQEELNRFFNKWKKEGHTNDYAKRFKAFWNWWTKLNLKKGIAIPDVCDELETTNKSESSFVWLKKEEFDKFRGYFDEYKQLLLLFAYETIVRSPSELEGLRVEDIEIHGEEVWVNIRDEISKTYGRRFNLVYSGDLIRKYIEGKDSKEPLFKFSSPMINKEMQQIAFQLWKDKRSPSGELYCNITLYDLRHSGAIHFRQLFQKTGQSLDSLRHRGGWTDLRMINYYTKFLGLDGHIQKEKLLLQEDKTRIEKEVSEIKEREKQYAKMFAHIKKEMEALKKEKERLVKVK